MATELTQKFKKIFEGSKEGFYLSDPNKVTVKPNGGERWETARGDGYQELNEAIQGHLEGSQK